MGARSVSPSRRSGAPDAQRLKILRVAVTQQRGCGILWVWRRRMLRSIENTLTTSSGSPRVSSDPAMHRTSCRKRFSVASTQPDGQQFSRSVRTSTAVCTTKLLNSIARREAAGQERRSQLDQSSSRSGAASRSSQGCIHAQHPAAGGHRAHVLGRLDVATARTVDRARPLAHRSLRSPRASGARRAGARCAAR